MGDGRIFLKSLRDVSFNKDLSNEPTFGQTHLAGQYLKQIFYFSFYIFPNYMFARSHAAVPAASMLIQLSL
jgi:hypothetical protein